MESSERTASFLQLFWHFCVPKNRKQNQSDRRDVEYSTYFTIEKAQENPSFGHGSSSQTTQGVGNGGQGRRVDIHALLIKMCFRMKVSQLLLQLMHLSSASPRGGTLG